MDQDDLRDLVAYERRVRGLSVRRASSLGGISNTTWGEWESAKRDLSTGVRRAVAQAFGWDPEWPENPPVRQPQPGEPTLAEIDAKLDEILRQVGRMGAALAQLADPARSASTPPDRVADPARPTPPRRSSRPSPAS